MVIVGDTGMGEWYVIRAGGAVEPVVEILHPTEAYDQPTEIAAEDFGAFLLDGVRTGLGLT